MTIIDETWNIYIHSNIPKLNCSYISLCTMCLIVRFFYLIANLVYIHTKKMELYKTIKEGVIYYRHFDGWKAKLEDWLPTFHL